jgi:hypothetical protein
MTSYSPTPKRYSRMKAYLYFKQTLKPFFQVKNARKTNDTTRALLLAAIDKNYVEGCAQNLKICGQTTRNHLKQLNPQQSLQINQQTIKTMQRKGALTKPLTLAIDWHDIMYYVLWQSHFRGSSRRHAKERFLFCLPFRHSQRST